MEGCSLEGVLCILKMFSSHYDSFVLLTRKKNQKHACELVSDRAIPCEGFNARPAGELADKSGSDK